MSLFKVLVFAEKCKMFNWNKQTHKQKNKEIKNPPPTKTRAATFLPWPGGSGRIKDGGEWEWEVSGNESKHNIISIKVTNEGEFNQKHFWRI